MVELTETDIFNIYKEESKDLNRAFELIEVRFNKYDNTIVYATFKWDTHRFLPISWLSKLSKITSKQWNIQSIDSDKDTFTIEIWLE